ncbi:RHS repeat-associated core domain-containing protein [Polyangium sorediatum]|uniref:RHS repeat-associated core domain-containing protein n=1 Tax=Polyangium sorediatum TaxID=889274 RepID=A0ABT6P2T1_9BACT|nr:RHS repeat-associated core domain-containing protein [Polyangium sorediatum]MDI1434916.1 RHS repeat-associated core domain-containing protein [Polyangium sorediatum]
MLASTMFDPVIGLDLHVVGIPAPPSPVPIPTPVPMPFVGLVFDPVGLAVCAAVGMAAGGGPGLVLINGMPATNTGTNATNFLTLPHLPAPGVTFVPPPSPGNNAELIFGSLGITLGGSLGVRLGDVALSCSEPVRMPTSAVLAVPKGAPVLINRPMVPDAKGIAFAAGVRAGMRALGRAVRAGGKLFRSFRQMQKRSAAWGQLSQGLRKAVDHAAPLRFRDRIKREICFATGHPVEVATGRVFTDCVDLALPGPIPLVFERVYSSSLSWRKGPLGYGWSHSLDQSVWCERGKAVYRAEDGREIEFLLGHLPDRLIRTGDRVYEPTNRLTLKACGEHRWEIEGIDGLVHEFAPADGDDSGRARLARIATKDGHAIECLYDRKGRLSRVIDSGGRTLRFGYDGADRLREIKVPHPREGLIRHVKYEFDAESNLARAVDALGNAHAYAYKGHLLVKETDRAGLSFYFQYDGNGHFAKCVRTWGDGGIHDHVIHYDEKNRRTIVVDSLGFATMYQRDELGNVVAVTNPMMNVAQYGYDPESGQEASITDPLGREEKREYDARGNVVAIVRPDGTRVELSYERDRPVRVVDEVGGVWRYRYDGAGRMRAAINPLGEQTRYRWSRGLLREVTDPMGGKVALSYDEAKSIAGIRYPNGGDERLVHDELGRVVEHRDARGEVTRVRRDALGRVVEVESPDGNHARIRHDAEGNVLEVSDHARRVKFAYAGFHWRALREDDGAAVRMRYDTEGRMMAIENEAGEEHAFVRDPCGRVVAERGFEGRTTRYTLDAAGQVVKARRESGKLVTYDRDALGRVTCVRYADGTAERFAYRADGMLVEAANDTMRVSFERDAMGRVVREVQGAHTVERRYDGRGQLAEVSSSLGFDGAFLRDAAGELAGISLGTGIDRWRAEIVRDGAGLEAERRLPGGIAVRTRRDRMGRVAETAFLDDLREVRRIRYLWAPGDLLKERNDSARGTARYTHDLRARLTAAEEPGVGVRWRRPGATGNLQKAVEGEPQQYGKGSVLLESEGVRFEHDRDGNRTAKVLPGGRREKYTWNEAGRLVAVTKVDGTVVRFAYDALGRRVRKASPADERVWIWDGDVPLHELSLREGPTTWIFEPGTFTPTVKVQGMRRWAIVADQVGAPCAVFDEWGGVAWQGAVNVFGRVAVEVEKTAVPWRFPGQYEDAETGLCYNRFRYYDPETGRYISKDPIGLAGGIEAYAYVEDPLAWIDPLGLAGEIVWVRTVHEAKSRAAEFAQVPRVSRGGVEIPVQNLNQSSRGENFQALNIRSSNRVAEGKSPLSLGRAKIGPTGLREQYWELHPDGHPDDPTPVHHNYPHVHARNAAGDERVFVSQKKKMGKCT